MNNNHVTELNEVNFEQEVLGAADPVVVHFWAAWSEPCRVMAPLLESVVVADAMPMKLARVNVDHHEELAERYGVRALPTLLIFNRGGLQGQIVGRATEAEVREKLGRLQWICRSQARHACA